MQFKNNFPQAAAPTGLVLLAWIILWNQIIKRYHRDTLTSRWSNCFTQHCIRWWFLRTWWDHEHDFIHSELRHIYTATQPLTIKCIDTGFHPSLVNAIHIYSSLLHHHCAHWVMSHFKYCCFMANFQKARQARFGDTHWLLNTDSGQTLVASYLYTS